MLVGICIVLFSMERLAISQSEKLADDVYEMPWDCMNKKNRRVVWFMLTRAQTPIRVTAMGLITVGVTTMAKVVLTFL